MKTVLFALALLGLISCQTSKVAVPTPATADAYWSGKVPRGLVFRLNKSESIIDFVGTGGKKAGFAKVMLFGNVADGTYKFSKEEGESVFYSNGTTTVSLSPTSPSAGVFVNSDGYEVMKAQKSDLVVGDPTAPPKSQPNVINPWGRGSNPNEQNMPQNVQNGKVINPWVKPGESPFPTAFPGLAPGAVPPIPTGEPAQDLPR
jgi:hypothetical protein